MQLEARTLLFDMQGAAHKIRSFTSGRTFADYQADSMLRSAVERQFEILGEALNRLAKLDVAIASRVGDYRRIISFRNALIHGYDSIQDEVVWGVLDTGLPALEKAVSELLDSD
jgi:uncharacterized protein with HEPN domain